MQIILKCRQCLRFSKVTYSVTQPYSPEGDKKVIMACGHTGTFKTKQASISSVMPHQHVDGEAYTSAG